MPRSSKWCEKEICMCLITSSNVIYAHVLYKGTQVSVVEHEHSGIHLEGGVGCTGISPLLQPEELQ